MEALDVAARERAGSPSRGPALDSQAVAFPEGSSVRLRVLSTTNWPRRLRGENPSGTSMTAKQIPCSVNASGTRLELARDTRSIAASDCHSRSPAPRMELRRNRPSSNPLAASPRNVFLGVASRAGSCPASPRADAAALCRDLVAQQANRVGGRLADRATEVGGAMPPAPPRAACAPDLHETAHRDRQSIGRCRRAGRRGRSRNRSPRTWRCRRTAR